MDANELGDLLLEVLPPDGSTLGNLSARQALSKEAGEEVSEEQYDQIRDKALLVGTIKKGRGRGGSIALGEGIEEDRSLHFTPTSIWVLYLTP